MPCAARAGKAGSEHPRRRISEEALRRAPAAVLGSREDERKVILDRDLLEVHLDARFIHDDHGRITTTNEPPPDRRQVPRFYLGWSSGSRIWRFRDDLSPTACAEFGDLAAVEPVSPNFRRAPVNSASMADVLASEQGGRGGLFRTRIQIPGVARPIAECRENSPLE